jgi:hypothetical protein
VKHVEDLLIDDDVEKMIVMLAAKEPEVQLHRQWALPTQWEAILPTTSILRGQHFQRLSQIQRKGSKLNLLQHRRRPKRTLGELSMFCKIGLLLFEVLLICGTRNPSTTSWRHLCFSAT